MANNRIKKLHAFVDGITGNIPPIGVCKELYGTGLYFLSDAVIENVIGHKSDIFADYGIFLDSNGFWKCWFTQYFLYDDIAVPDSIETTDELKSFCMVTDNVSIFKEIGEAFVSIGDRDKYKINGNKNLIFGESPSLIYAVQDSSKVLSGFNSLSYLFNIYFKTKTSYLLIAESIQSIFNDKFDFNQSIYNTFGDATAAVYQFTDAFIIPVSNLYSKVGADIVSTCDNIINGDAENVPPIDYSANSKKFKK